MERKKAQETRKLINRIEALEKSRENSVSVPLPSNSCNNPCEDKEEGVEDEKMYDKVNRYYKTMLTKQINKLLEQLKKL